jgi:hypothetical protein
MSELSLRAGDALRIRSGGRLIVLRSTSICRVRVVKRGAAVRLARRALAWWLRLYRLGGPAFNAYRRREVARRIALRL